nr:hypothetical protein [Campylobacter sp.]
MSKFNQTQYFKLAVFFQKYSRQVMISLHKFYLYKGDKTKSLSTTIIGKNLCEIISELGNKLSDK